MRPVIGVTLIVVAIAGAAADEIEDLLREANNQLTFKIFSEYAKVNMNNSYAISGFQLLPSLGLLAVASEGSTRDEIMHTLGFKNEAILKQAIVRARSKLEPAPPNIKAHVVNRFFIPLKYKMNDNFNKTNWDIFGTDVKNADLLNKTCVQFKINEWVRSIGHNDLMFILMKSDTKGFLVNFLNFKGVLKTQFIIDDTRLQFALTNKVYTGTFYMYREAKFMYAESKEMDAKILEIPYEGDEASLVIILPNKVDAGLTSLLQKVKDISIIKGALAKLQPVNTKIGIKKIFDNKTSEITKMGKEPLHVSDIAQSLFFKTDVGRYEKDPKEAASNKNETKTFTAKHTYAFLIKLRGIVLLSGIYNGDRCVGMVYRDDCNGIYFLCCMYKDSGRR